MSGDRIPVTIVGGYLGAGKTTLVNRVLTGSHGQRIAVIVNDFGDVSIDEALLGPATGGVRALANGCVCCAAVDGLAMALAEIASLDPRPEHLIIEVSGVGDPWAVAQWGRTPGYELGAVVVVADPGQIRDWAADRYVGDTVRHQLEVADLVVLSRADVTSADTRNDVEAWLRDLTGASVLHGTDLPLAFLLGPVRPSSPRTAAPHADHLARSLRPGACTRLQLCVWLENVPAGVVRVKGFAPATEDGAENWFVQLAGRRGEVVAHRSAAAAGLVVIATEAAEVGAVTDWLRALPSESAT